MNGVWCRSCCRTVNAESRAWRAPRKFVANVSELECSSSSVSTRSAANFGCAYSFEPIQRLVSCKASGSASRRSRAFHWDTWWTVSGSCIILDRSTCSDSPASQGGTLDRYDLSGRASSCKLAKATRDSAMQHPRERRPLTLQERDVVARLSRCS